MLKRSFIYSAVAFALSVTLTGCQTDSAGWPKATASSGHVPAVSAEADTNRDLPALVVTDQPAPEVIYRRGSRDTVLANADTSAATGLPRYSKMQVETLVTRKVSDLGRDLTQLQRTVDSYAERLQDLQSESDSKAAQYYELVASVNTELQSGTTPGNPVLVERWNVAQKKLEDLSLSAGYLNGLATDLSNEASKAVFLQENVRAAYSLSGAVEEDHRRLREVEDGVNRSIVGISRLLTSVNDEINRRTAYLRAERANMQTLSLAISNGELYGQNIANSLYKRATETGTELFKDTAGGAAPTSRKPLVIIRFDRPGVNYEQALYSAVGQALDRYPAAKFDLFAISPSEGNPAQIALASTEARKNGEDVLRSLTQMGLPVERIRLNAAQAQEVRNSEVHLFIQ